MLYTYHKQTQHTQQGNTAYMVDVRAVNKVGAGDRRRYI